MRGDNGLTCKKKTKSANSAPRFGRGFQGKDEGDEEYAEVDVPISMIRKFKESYSYVGESESGARVKVPVDGKPRKIEIGKRGLLQFDALVGAISNT